MLTSTKKMLFGIPDTEIAENEFFSTIVDNSELKSFFEYLEVEDLDGAKRVLYYVGLLLRQIPFDYGWKRYLELLSLKYENGEWKNTKVMERYGTEEGDLDQIDFGISRKQVKEKKKGSPIYTTAWRHFVLNYHSILAKEYSSQIEGFLTKNNINKKEHYKWKLENGSMYQSLNRFIFFAHEEFTYEGYRFVGEHEISMSQEEMVSKYDVFNKTSHEKGGYAKIHLPQQEKSSMSIY